MPKSLRYIGRLFSSTWREVKANPLKYLILIGIGIVLAFVMMPHDHGWLDNIRKDPAIYPGVHDAAGKVSHYTMYTFTPLLLCTLLWIGGWLSGKKSFKKAALVCFVAGTMGGILVNFLRPGFGRPRPRAEKVDKFHYFEVDSDMLSFPSGHVMSNMAGATALTIVQPWIGVPYVIATGASGWSRMQRDAHYPTDVTVGAIFGAVVGIAFANGMLLMRKDEAPLETE